MASRAFPLRVGCVDAGSNAIRFLVAEFSDPQTYETLAYQRVPIRLGHQVFLTGKLATQAMDAAVEAFASFWSRLKDLELHGFRAVATSAVREAKNGEEFVGRLLSEANIHLEMISGSEEARLVHQAVASRLELAGSQWILTDLGGGSVEVSLVDDMGMLWTESHTMGSVRLLEELTDAKGDPVGFPTLLSDYISTLRIPAPAQYWSPAGFVATGGNIEALATLAARPRDMRGVTSLPVRDLDKAINLLSTLSYQDRIEQLGLREDRADVILPAALVYRHLAGLADADAIIVPGVGVKEGLVLDLVDELVSSSDHRERQEQQLAKSAISLGRRFMFDEAHGMHVGRLALSIFDQLQELHGMGAEDRRLLFAAAILHDVGAFVSRKGHHKHSLYLISRSELPGLSPKQMLMVANIARYHRKNIPLARHPEFMRLDIGNRERVTKLAALLRIADSLDRAHLQHVQDVRVSIRPREVVLALEGESLLERWALARKKSLFEKVFKRSVSFSK